MKALACAVIFWIALWTCPSAAPWYERLAVRAIALTWGFYLSCKILTVETK